ncbi:hypothetical protein E4U22_007422 [Claviceps purpurea]|nr:hypothetical protein E4U22_007422 [Claviceps purpurea]
MDELPEPTSPPPPALPITNRRDTLQLLLTTSRPRSPQTGSALSNSEPSLRFPRPQGNRRLANWISTSTPDMMDVTAEPEESGLAESAYELIATPVDQHLHDDQYTGSTSESVGSLEFQPSDDVHSLTGTEHTYDDESIIDEDSEPLARSMIHEEAVDVYNEHNAPLQEEPFDPESESEAEALSHSSLEYTQHILKTPSILTPEASNIWEPCAEKPPRLGSREKALKYQLTSVYDAFSRFWDYAAGTVSAVLPGIIFAALFTLLINHLYPSPVQFVNDPRSVATSTLVATTTPAVIYTSRSTSTTPPAPETPTQRYTTSGKSTSLIVINDGASDDWLFSSKKPEIQFTPLGQSVIMVHVASDVTHAWLKNKNCLFMTTDRQGQQVKTTFVQSSDGFTVKFPKNETHGVVKLTVQATCRPSVTKSVKIHFGKGIMEEAYEMTRNLASDISGLVPVAAHEAEKCLIGAKKSFSAVSDSVTSSVVTASDNLLCSIRDSAHRMQVLVGEQPWSLPRSTQAAITSLSVVLDSLRTQIMHKLKESPALETSIRDSMSHARLRLLTAQIAAKMWWLGISGQKSKRDEYGQKAKMFMDSMRDKGQDETNRPHRAQPHQRQHVRHRKCSAWSKRGLCKGHERRGR